MEGWTLKTQNFQEPKIKYCINNYSLINIEVV